MIFRKRFAYTLISTLLMTLLVLSACQSQANEPSAPAAIPSPIDTLPPDASPAVEMTFAEANVDAVSVTVPPEGQAVAVVSGAHRDGCTSIYDVSTGYAAQTFTIDLTSQRPANMDCTQQIVPFTERVLLDVTEKPAGEYTVVANGVETQLTLGSAATAVITTSAAQMRWANVYLVALEDDGQNGTPVGCGDSLVPIRVEITPGGNPPLVQAIEALLNVEQLDYGEGGRYNALHASELSVDNVEIADGHATVFITGDLQVGGTCDAPRISGQLEQTALQFEALDTVTFLINGTPLDDLLDARG